MVTSTDSPLADVAPSSASELLLLSLLLLLLLLLLVAAAANFFFRLDLWAFLCFLVKRCCGSLSAAGIAFSAASACLRRSLLFMLGVLLLLLLLLPLLLPLLPAAPEPFPATCGSPSLGVSLWSSLLLLLLLLLPLLLPLTLPPPLLLVRRCCTSGMRIVGLATKRSSGSSKAAPLTGARLCCDVLCSSSKLVGKPVSMLLLLCCVLASITLVPAVAGAALLQLAVAAVLLLSAAVIALESMPRTGDVLRPATLLRVLLLAVALGRGATVRPRAR
jgi:hypothetical protein